MDTTGGSMMLSLSLFVFILALVAVGGVGWLLWQDAGHSSSGFQQLLTQRTVSASMTPSPTTDALRPEVTIETSLQGQASEFEDQLVTPLRAYYATKSERLVAVTITPSDTPKHTAKVVYELNEGPATTQHTFYYDRTGEDKKGPYPDWSPSLLDITE